MVKKVAVKKRIKGLIKKVTAKEAVFVNFVLDKTGSMDVCREATISGFNEYIDSLKKENPGVKFTLTLFNSEDTTVLYDGVVVKDVKHLDKTTYNPQNQTPLYDAIATTIKSMEKASKGKKVLCVIMTDGEENASKEYTREKIFNLIKEKEKDGWVFVYLGANQDSWQVCQSIGLKKGNVINYNTGKTGVTFAAAAKVSNYYASNRGLVSGLDMFADANVDAKWLR